MYCIVGHSWWFSRVKINNMFAHAGYFIQVYQKNYFQHWIEGPALPFPISAQVPIYIGFNPHYVQMLKRTHKAELLTIVLFGSSCFG